MEQEVQRVVAFDVKKARNDFPILSQKAYGKPLVYFDNAATSQKPRQVIEALTRYYSESNANIHRGVHYLSQKASAEFDEVRVKVKQLLNAGSDKEIIFTRGTTEGINLVASSWGRKNIGPGDEIVITAMEHHSNIVPWQMLCEEKKAVLRVIPMSASGELLAGELEKLLSPKTRFISIVHTSNSLGTVNPVKEIIQTVRAYTSSKRGDSGPESAGYIPVLVDGAQAVAHASIDVRDLDCDFFAFSGHKAFGPTGVGCLYGKLAILEAMPPYQGGGEMIHSVSFEKTTYNEVPFKFEAGTPNIADVVGLGAAVDYIRSLDRKAVAVYEQSLLRYATEKLSVIPAVKLIGTAADKASVVSFVLKGVNALDAGMYLDTLGVAVRTGHHCTEPVMDFLKIPGTIRASFLFYNTKEEIEVMVEGLRKAIVMLAPKA